VPSRRVRNPVPCSPVRSDDRAFCCDESVTDHRPPLRLSWTAIFCRPLIAWFSGERSLSMIYDRWSRRAPGRSASLTASAARNRVLPSDRRLGLAALLSVAATLQVSSICVHGPRDDTSLESSPGAAKQRHGGHHSIMMHRCCEACAVGEVPHSCRCCIRGEPLAEACCNVRPF